MYKLRNVVLAAAVMVGAGLANAPLALATTTYPGLAATASNVWGGLSPDYGALDNLTNAPISVALAIPLTINPGAGTGSTQSITVVIGGKSANATTGQITCSAFSQTKTGAGNAFAVTPSVSPSQVGVNTTFSLGALQVPTTGTLFAGCTVGPGAQLLSISY